MVTDDPGAAPADRASMRRELDRLREFARGLSLDDVRGGGWFAALLRYSMDSYVRQVDAASFAARYPGLSPDQAVQARIRAAARLASLEGGLSAGAYTGAVAATLGSGGAASPITLPAAGAGFVLDLLFLSHLQLRLTHDISVLYGVPLQLDDPEDLWKLIRTAFALKGGEAGGEVLGLTVPVLVRPALGKVLGGPGLTTATRSLPTVGRFLLQRNVTKLALPVVGVPLSMAVNHWSTRLAGAQAVRVFRPEGRIAEAARRMVGATEHHAELLWILWLIVKSDALIHENERLLLKHATALVGDLESELSAITGLDTPHDVDEKVLWAKLAAATDDLTPLYDAAVVAAAVDGKINANELSNLRKLADFCRVPYDEQAVRRIAAVGV